MYTLLADVVRRTRQHHAIEHATIHILSLRFPDGAFSAYSDPLGFTLYGDVTEAELRRAVGDGLLRLQAGEHALSLHPNCGTNLAVSALLATLAAFLGGGGRRTFIERFATALTLVLVAMVAAKPIGYWLQAYTTLAEVADRWVAEIRPVSIGNRKAYRVRFD